MQLSVPLITQFFARLAFQLAQVHQSFNHLVKQ